MPGCFNLAKRKSGPASSSLRRRASMPSRDSPFAIWQYAKSENNLERCVEFREIRYALSVAKERSFTKAAARLNISQSAVSEQVRLLEEEIGFPLFRRTSRGIELTEPGRTFLYETGCVVGDVLSLSDTARRLRGAPSDTLTIGMVLTCYDVFGAPHRHHADWQSAPLFRRARHSCREALAYGAGIRRSRPR